MQPDPNREFAIQVVERLRAAGFESLWAGGCVRDLLLGRMPKDYDVATNARPEEVRDVFGPRRTLNVGASFGVIVVLPPRGVEPVEVATFRSEGPYKDGRRPERVVFTTAEEDAQRRDFTINGMFYDPLSQTVHDYVGGEHDLSEGILRAIGNPAARMQEDKLRMLRAIRFAATLDFALDQPTQDAVTQMAGELQVVSAERIAQELRRLLVDRHRRRGVRLLKQTGLLTVIFPEFEPLLTQGDTSAWERTEHRLHLLDDPSFPLATAALWFDVVGRNDCGKVARQMARRLKLSNDESQRIVRLCEQADWLDQADRLPLHRLKRILSQKHAEELLQLVRVRQLAEEADLHSVLFCEDFLRRTPDSELDPPPLVTGDDLIAAGLQPGKEFKTLLDTVRNAQLDGDLKTKFEALAWVRSRVNHSA